MWYLIAYLVIGVIFMLGIYKPELDSNPNAIYIVIWPIVAIVLAMQTLVLIGKFIVNYHDGIRR